MSAVAKIGASARQGAPAAEALWKPLHNPWAVALTVTLATFMEVLDTSIANVALPHIAGGLSASTDESTWVLTSYLVSNAIVLPISGWISGIIGRKRFYMGCVALFTISSFLCGLAPTLGILILFRVIQGAGGGGLQPSEQSILADTFPPQRRGMAFAVYGMAVVLAPAVGPTLGGYITDNLNWRWIFFINVPVGVISLLLTYRMVEDPPYLQRTVASARRSLKIDYVGLSLIALGLGALQVALDKGQEDDWLSSHFIVVCLVAALVGLVLFTVWEWFSDHPVIDLHLLARPTFAAASIMMFLLGAVLFGTTVLIPQFLQEVLHYSAQQAGMVLSPGGLVIIMMMPLVGMLVTRVDARWLIGFGFFATALALFRMSDLDLQVDFHTVMLYRIYQSAGLAFLFIPINTMSYAGVPQEKNREVSAMINLFRNIGGSVGISMVTTMLARRAQVHQDRLVVHVTEFDAAFRAARHSMSSELAHHGLGGATALSQSIARIYASLQVQAAVLSYVDTIWIMGIACLSIVPFVFLMKRNDPGQALAAH